MGDKSSESFDDFAKRLNKDNVLGLNFLTEEEDMECYEEEL